MALSAISYLIGHLCVCVFSSNISSESMLLFGAEHCLPSYWPSVCVCVFKISQVSLCYYLEKNAEHYIVCHLLSYWPERPLQRPSISNLIGRRSTAVRPYLLFLDNFLDFSTKKIPKIFITQHFNKNTNTNTNTKTIWLAGGPVRPYLLFLSRFSESIKRKTLPTIESETWVISSAKMNTNWLNSVRKIQALVCCASGNETEKLNSFLCFESSLPVN